MFFPHEDIQLFERAAEVQPAQPRFLVLDAFGFDARDIEVALIAQPSEKQKNTTLP
jgi:hypothetical protein